jgi:hypothetical protein
MRSARRIRSFRNRNQTITPTTTSARRFGRSPSLITPIKIPTAIAMRNASTGLSRTAATIIEHCAQVGRLLMADIRAASAGVSGVIPSKSLTDACWPARCLRRSPWRSCSGWVFSCPYSSYLFKSPDPLRSGLPTGTLSPGRNHARSRPTAFHNKPSYPTSRNVPTLVCRRTGSTRRLERLREGDSFERAEARIRSGLSRKSKISCSARVDSPAITPIMVDDIYYEFNWFRSKLRVRFTPSV